MALGGQIGYQLPAAPIVVIRNADAVLQIPVDPVEEYQGHLPGNELAVQVQIGVGQGGFGALHQNAVYLFLPQQVQEYPPLLAHLIGGGVKHGGAVVGRKHRLHFPQHRGEDVFRNIGGNNGDGPLGLGRSVFGIQHPGTAALTPLNQPLSGKTVQGCPDGLAADIKAAAQLLLGGQHGAGREVSPKNLFPQSGGQKLIFERHTGHLADLYGMYCHEYSRFVIP